MKIRKILSAFLAMTVVLSCLSAVPVSAGGISNDSNEQSESLTPATDGESGTLTVYVDAASGDDANGGSEAEPVKTIDRAIEKINAQTDEIATIHFLSNYTVSTTSAVQMPEHAGKTVTYTASSGVNLSMGQSIYLNGNTIFKSIGIENTAANERHIFAQGHSLFIGDSVTKSGEKGITINAICNNATYKNGDITVNSGTWSKVYSTSAWGGTATGNVDVTIGGTATVTNLYVGSNGGATGGTNGTTSIYLNSGKVTNVYIGQNSSQGTVVFGNDVNIFVKETTITTIGITAYDDGNTTYKTVNIDVSNMASTAATTLLGKVKTSNDNIDCTKYFRATLGAFYVDSISGDDTNNDARTADTAAATINGAVAKVNAMNTKLFEATATVKIVGAVDFGGWETGHKNTLITYMGETKCIEETNEEGTITKEIEGTINLTNAFQVNSPVIFENIIFTYPDKNASGATITYRNIIANGNKLVMGDGVRMPNGKNIRLYGCQGGTYEKVDVTINSGTYQRVYLTYSYDNVITGNVRYVINGGTISTFYAGGSDQAQSSDTAKNEVQGVTDIIVNGGTITDFFIGAASTREVEFKGTVTVKLNGGKVVTSFGACTQDDKGNKTYNYENTTFADGVVVDYSSFDATLVDELADWKGKLNSDIESTTDYAKAFISTDISAFGTQNSIHIFIILNPIWMVGEVVNQF